MIYYSPSQTADYLKCPTYWKIGRKWSPRLPWTPHLHVGAAMSNALAVFRLNPTEEGYRLALEAASATLEERYEENVGYTLAGLNQLFKKGFDEALNTTVSEQLDNEIVVGCEVPIGEGRIDYVSRRKSNNRIIVTDDKVKLSLRADYINKTLMEAEQDWQLWDYAARATEFYGEAPEFIRRHVIILSPRAKAVQQVFPVKPEAIEQHKFGSSATWFDMERDEQRMLVQVAMNKTQCINKYGKCDKWDACHVLFRDENKFDTLFDKKE